MFVMNHKDKIDTDDSTILTLQAIHIYINIYVYIYIYIYIYKIVYIVDATILQIQNLTPTCCTQLFIC
jgi:hypothetical protein